MDYDIINKFLSRKGKVHIYELKKAVQELKSEATTQRMKNVDDEHEKYYYFYDGQVNAYCMCLDLLEDFEKRLENK